MVARTSSLATQAAPRCTRCGSERLVKNGKNAYGRQQFRCRACGVTRAELLRLYGGEDDTGFREHLADWFYDLHYVPLPGAQPFSFGLGNLWRIAIEYPGCPVSPCIHRAPLTLPGMATRLLLIS